MPGFYSAFNNIFTLLVEKENVISNMKKLSRRLQTQKVSFLEKETSLLNKNKNLTANLIELNIQLTASEESIKNLLEQQELMFINSDDKNDDKNNETAFADALVVVLNKEIKQLKSDLEIAQTSTTVIIIFLFCLYYLFQI